MSSLLKGDTIQNGADPLTQNAPPSNFEDPLTPNAAPSNFEFVATNTITTEADVVKVEPGDVFENEDDTFPLCSPDTDQDDLDLPDLSPSIPQICVIEEDISDKAMDLFFCDVAKTVKNFGPEKRIRVRSEISRLINNMGSEEDL